MHITSDADTCIPGNDPECYRWNYCHTKYFQNTKKKHCVLLGMRWERYSAATEEFVLLLSLSLSLPPPSKCYCLAISHCDILTNHFALLSFLLDELKPTTRAGERTGLRQSHIAGAEETKGQPHLPPFTCIPSVITPYSTAAVPHSLQQHFSPGFSGSWRNNTWLSANSKLNVSLHEWGGNGDCEKPQICRFHLAEVSGKWQVCFKKGNSESPRTRFLSSDIDHQCHEEK